MPSRKQKPQNPLADPLRSRAALKAWETMNSAPYRASRTARLSQEALRTWAIENGFHCTFLDSPSGNPRTGIVDAVLVRVGKSNPDSLEIHLVQLKGGDAGLTPTERTRLLRAVGGATIVAALAMWDRDNMAVDVIGEQETGVSQFKTRSRSARR